MKKIIIVDRIRQQLDFEISPECGEVETITAYSNEGALIVHQKKKADLIITELYGSGMKAVQLCSAIREDPDLRKVSVIVFCRDNEIELRESRQCRANAVMTLPVQSRLLRSTLQRFLMVPERADYRLPFTARSARLSGRSHFECEVENISVTGMLIEADAALKKGDWISCSLTLPPAVIIETQAEVTRTVKTASDQNKYGLRFSDLGPAGRHAIETLIQQRQ
jgi:CheY-like chemotaxis protein